MLISGKGFALWVNRSIMIDNIPLFGEIRAQYETEQAGWVLLKFSFISRLYYCINLNFVFLI